MGRYADRQEDGALGASRLGGRNTPFDRRRLTGDNHLTRGIEVDGFQNLALGGLDAHGDDLVVGKPEHGSHGASAGGHRLLHKVATLGDQGNGIGKAASYFGNAKNAGVILGARVPIVLVSRSDSAYSKLASIAAGSVLASRMHLA